jgi:hypothetical protein
MLVVLMLVVDGCWLLVGCCVPGTTDSEHAGALLVHYLGDPNAVHDGHALKARSRPPRKPVSCPLRLLNSCGHVLRVLRVLRAATCREPCSR